MSRTTDIATGAGIVIGLLLMFAGAMRLIAPAPASPDAPLWGVLTTQAIWILLALCGGVLPRSGGLGERLSLRRGSLSISTSLVLVVGFIALSSALHQGLVSLELRETGSLAEIDAMVRSARARAPSFLLALLAFAVAPGFGEEILFRGLLQRELTARIGASWGVLLASALFGLAHFDPVQSPLAFVLGAYLGIVTLLAGSVRTAILCHLLNNTLGVLAPGLIPVSRGPAGPYLIAPLLALAAVALCYAAWRRGPAGKGCQQDSE